MNPALLEDLCRITEEEQEILEGKTTINRNLYYSAAENTSRGSVIDSARVLEDGKLIDIRPHVRFIHFPKHTHNYVEFIYMCQGSTTHLIDGHRITLTAGDLLFLNQHATQEILPAGEKDVAVNFMIRPEFFDTAFRMMGQEENALREFIVSCLTRQDMGGNYLYYHVSDITPVQNLLENLILTMKSDLPNKRTLSQNTMGLLFLHLMNYTDQLQLDKRSYDEEVVIRLLSYIDGAYKDASLSRFSEDCGLDIYTLSRLIKRFTGRSFLDLLQEKRLSHASYLLLHTSLTVDDVSLSVGYDNTSYFHRLFRSRFGMTPRSYRISAQSASPTN